MAQFEMSNKEDNVSWMEKRMEEYRLGKNDMNEVVDDFDEVGKLGHGFTLMDKLEEVDIGRGVVRRPTYVNANMEPRQKEQVMRLLEEFMKCFVWEYIVRCRSKQRAGGA
jgi:hypothetical protein